MKTLDVASPDLTRLDDAELADMMATTRRLAQETYGAEAAEESEASANRLVKEILGGFVSAYFQMVSAIGAENAYSFASRFIQREDLKPPPHPRGKANAQLDAHLVAIYEAAPEGEQWAAISRAMPDAEPKEVSAAVRRLQRRVKAREDRRELLEAQGQVSEIIRDWHMIRVNLERKDDKS